MRHTVARVTYESRRACRSEQRQNRLNRNVHGEHVERLERGPRHALSVGLGVQRNFREQDGMFLGRNLEQTEETWWECAIQRVP